jgi:hypothetical protein
VEALTSAAGSERTIQWDGYLYVPAGADGATIDRAIQRQVKSAIGALRRPEIGIQGASRATWRTEAVSVVDTANPSAAPSSMLRVRYHYRDTALARRGDEASSLALPVLFGDYVGRAAEIAPACSDEPTGEADSLWLHFAPELASCQAAMAREVDAVSEAEVQVGAEPGKVSRAEVARLYLTVRAELTKVAAPPRRYPEYDRLWGFGTDRKLLVVYTFFGVDRDEQSPEDVSAVEHLRFWRTLRAAYPGLAVTFTSPADLLLDFQVEGQPLSGATFEDVFAWVIDGRGFPAAAPDPARRRALRAQAVRHFAERWIHWELPVTVTRGATRRDMTVQLRSYWGYEDGSPEHRQKARWRYLEGMWHGDVFVYQGHSHFGHGPLEPAGYGPGNFPDRYQSMLINSCASFNYYDADFLAMHPGGSRNLDIVVNGLPATWERLGEASARYVIGLIDGKNRSWQDILAAMVVRPSWAPDGYDPLRAVNGELDNLFDPRAGPITVTPR